MRVTKLRTPSNFDLEEKFLKSRPYSVDMSEPNPKRNVLKSLFKSLSRSRSVSRLMNIYAFFRIQKTQTYIRNNVTFAVDLFPKDEIEGIKDFYIYHNNPCDIYNRIIGYFLNTIHCDSIAFDESDNQICDNQTNDNQTVDGVNFIVSVQDKAEINLKIFKSRLYNDNNVYLIRIKRISGDYIKFWQIKQEIVDNVLCLYNGLPAEFTMDSSTNDYAVTPLSTDTIYDYSVYDNHQQMMDEEEDDDMVWIEN